MNVDKVSEIRVLIIKQLRETLSQEEDTALQSWIAASEHNRALYEELTDDESLYKALMEYIGFRKTIAPERQEAEPMQAARSNWWHYIAAASVLLMIAVVGYIWFKPTSQPVVTNEKAQPVPNIPPGKDGAVLTLSDGSQIVLDSAANGKLAEQGTATITHQDGQISYRAGSQPKGKVLYNTTSTPRGRQYKLQLSDGTSIWLNAASAVTYPTGFEDDKREITISGEVYLEVKHDKGKPFIVHIANSDTYIEVMGTQFVVNAYVDEPYVRTTLLNGEIQMTARVQGKSTSYRLQPGNQTKLSHENLELIKVANTEEATAFMNGFFYFDKADIKMVMRQLEKWYDLQVSFTQPVSTRTFEGEIQRNLPLPVVLKILERNGVQFSVAGNRVVVK